MDPITTALTWIGVTMAGGVTANTSDRVVCSVARGVRDRTAGLRDLPQNHDVARAVRLAQAQALDRLIRNHRALSHPDSPTDRIASPDPFHERALEVCAAIRTSDVTLDPDVSAPLTGAIDGILAPPAHDGPGADRAAAVARLAEDVVLNDFRAALGATPLPDGFETQFREGFDGTPPFLELFGAYIAEQIKTNDRFRAIFTTGQLSRIEGVVWDMDARFGGTLARLDDKTDRVLENQDTQDRKIDEILALVSADKGVPVAPLRAILEKLGEADVSLDQIPSRLAAKADEFLDVQHRWSRLTNQDPDVAAVREKALARMQAGDLDGARDLLSAARARIRDLRQERAREEATLLADEAGLDRLSLRYRDAADKLAEAAALVPFDPESATAYREAEAEDLYRQGNEFGDNAALEAAIDQWKTLLSQCVRDRAPQDWARMQNNLGNALMRLGERESGAARLEEAVTVYRLALEEYARECAPLDWARTQSNLGSALMRLGERESGTARWEEAVTAYRLALEEHTRERVPLNWAMTQLNLGNALACLGERENDLIRVQEAVAAHRAALEVFTPADTPAYHDIVQGNLEEALAALARLQDGG